MLQVSNPEYLFDYSPRNSSVLTIVKHKWVHQLKTYTKVFQCDMSTFIYYNNSLTNNIWKQYFILETYCLVKLVIILQSVDCNACCTQEKAHVMLLED